MPGASRERRLGFVVELDKSGCGGAGFVEFYIWRRHVDASKSGALVLQPLGGLDSIAISSLFQDLVRYHNGTLVSCTSLRGFSECVVGVMRCSCGVHHRRMYPGMSLDSPNLVVINVGTPDQILSFQNLVFIVEISF